MTTLPERLKAAVTERLDLARAAERVTPSPWSYIEARSVLVDGRGRDLAVIGYADGRHAAANDPATVIRMCERDLKLLEWLTNALVATIADGYNLAVGEPFRDMADAYGIPIEEETTDG